MAALSLRVIILRASFFCRAVSCLPASCAWRRTVVRISTLIVL